LKLLLKHGKRAPPRKVLPNFSIRSCSDLQEISVELKRLNRGIYEIWKLTQRNQSEMVITISGSLAI